MSTGGKTWLAIIIIALLSIIFSLVGPYSATKNSEQMGQAIASNLATSGYDDIDVNMSGNVAKLTGLAKSEQARQAALDLAQNTECQTCSFGKNKIWHEAKDDGIDIVKAAIVSPYTFSAVKSGDNDVVLNGYLRNDDEIESVLAQARSLFPGGVVDRTLKVASGEPSARWREVVGVNLSTLAQLDTGRVSMTDTATVLTGETSRTNLQAPLSSEYMAAIGAPYEAAINISAPDIAVAPVAEVNSQEVCQILFDQLKGDNRINFASGSANITPGPSTVLLDRLASAAAQCASFRISVEGHTDWQGDPAYNEHLSLLRATEVTNYLQARGVDASRMRAAGYGDKRPVASNETLEGMARNRRIEFIVTRSE